MPYAWATIGLYDFNSRIKFCDYSNFRRFSVLLLFSVCSAGWSSKVKGSNIWMKNWMSETEMSGWVLWMQTHADRKKRDVIRSDVIWIRYFECKHTFIILSRFMRICSERRRKKTAANNPNQFLNFHRMSTRAHALRKGEKASNLTWFFPCIR